jgi:hypothetical protein
VKRVIIIVGIVITANVLRAADTPPRREVTVRHHVELNDKRGMLYYKATIVDELSDERSRTRILVRDLPFGDYVLSRVRSFADQTTVISIADVQDKSFVRVTYKWPFTSKTRDETLAEARRHPELMDAPTIVTLETNGGKWEAVETEWRSFERRRELQTQVRQSMNTTLLEGIERMRGMVFPADDFKVFADLITTYVLHGTAGEVQQGLIATPAHPDCTFDKSFGVPCSDKQLAHIQKADEEHRPITDY